LSESKINTFEASSPLVCGILNHKLNPSNSGFPHP
jgi:hypothetical protein